MITNLDNNISVESLGHGKFLLRGHPIDMSYGSEVLWNAVVCIDKSVANIKGMLCVAKGDFSLKQAVTIKNWLDRQEVSMINWDKSIKNKGMFKKYEYKTH